MSELAITLRAPRPVSSFCARLYAGQDEGGGRIRRAGDLWAEVLCRPRRRSGWFEAILTMSATSTAIVRSRAEGTESGGSRVSLAHHTLQLPINFIRASNLIIHSSITIRRLQKKRSNTWLCHCFTAQGGRRSALPFEVMAQGDAQLNAAAQPADRMTSLPPA